MENRTHTEHQPQTRRLPFNDRLARRRPDEEIEDEVSRMENEGGPPPVPSANKDGRQPLVGRAVSAQDPS